jgi:hypothetical protein
MAPMEALKQEKVVNSTILDFVFLNDTIFFSKTMIIVHHNGGEKDTCIRCMRLWKDPLEVL